MIVESSVLVARICWRDTHIGDTHISIRRRDDHCATYRPCFLLYCMHGCVHGDTYHVRSGIAMKQYHIQHEVFSSSRYWLVFFGYHQPFNRSENQKKKKESSRLILVVNTSYCLPLWPMPCVPIVDFQCLPLMVTSLSVSISIARAISTYTLSLQVSIY